MNWRDEIVQLHEFFEAYYLGTESSLERAERALHADFTFVGPDGRSADRAATIEQLRAGHGHTDQLAIEVDDLRLLHDSGTTVVAVFVERHRLRDRTNQRIVTVVFDRDPEGPNGVRWRHVHETWQADESVPSTG